MGHLLVARLGQLGLDSCFSTVPPVKVTFNLIIFIPFLTQLTFEKSTYATETSTVEVENNKTAFFKKKLTSSCSVGCGTLFICFNRKPMGEDAHVYRVFFL